MITGVVLARNEAGVIEDCLRSLRPFVEELLLIDMESADGTAEAAAPYVDRILPHPYQSAFDAARNIAIPIAAHEWLWFLDADERVPANTGRLVRELLRSDGADFEALSIPFRTYFCGKWIQHSGWWPGYTMPRVLKRGAFRFADRLHGGVEVQGRQRALPADPGLAIEHYSYRDLEHYVEKFNRYTSEEARQLEAGAGSYGWRTAIREMMRDLWGYYELNNGQLDGQHGWILAWLAGQYRWFARTKLLDLKREEVAHVTPPHNLDEVLREMRLELNRLRANASNDGRLEVVVHSPIFDPSGYAEDGRFFLEALARGSRPVHLREIHWSETVAELPSAKVALLRSLLRSEPSQEHVAISHCIPTLVDPDLTARWNVLRTTFETDRIPEAWCDRFLGFDQIWVHADATRESFIRGGAPPEKLRVVPSGIDTELFRPDGPRRPLPAALAGRFVFLSVFDWQLRKGWDVLIAAFAEEFSAAESIGLMLKITRSHGSSLDDVREQVDGVLQASGQSLALRPEIVLEDSLLSAEELAGLYRTVDAFVLPSRGEGWGLPLLEAMASGKPVIATEGSAPSTYMNHGNSLLIPSQWTPVSAAAAAQIPVYLGHRWLEPDRASLRSLMRKVASNEALRCELGEQARSDVCEQYSFEPARRRAELALQELEAEPLPPRTEGLRVNLAGEFFAGHSFSNINEELAIQFQDCEGFSLCPARVVCQPVHERASSKWQRLRRWQATSHETPDVTIRHAFPPDFSRPANGKWVHIQPWEFGALPRDWVPPLRDVVDEIWAPSDYVKRAYVHSGIPENKIWVIPWGIDPETYRPDGIQLLLSSDDQHRFTFLYVGGAIERKGFDLLLDAYFEEFSAHDRVRLVIKDQGSQSYYRDSPLRQRMQDQMAVAEAPEVIYLDREMTDGQRAALYRACDCLVAPYRGEGFGLHILEALACATPPILPRGGPSDEFVAEDEGWFLETQIEECLHPWRLAAVGTELRPSSTDLKRAMREASGKVDACQQKGLRGSHRVRASLTWRHTAEAMSKRLQVVASQEPLALRAAAPTTVSVVVISRQTSRLLCDTLGRLKPFVDELLVMVGDETEPAAAAAAAEYGARVYALSGTAGQLRNAGLRRAVSDWILVLDAGEHLAEDDAHNLRARLHQLDGGVLGAFLRTFGGADASLVYRSLRLLRNRNDLLFDHDTHFGCSACGPHILDLPFEVQVIGSELCDNLSTDKSVVGSPRFWRGWQHSRAGNFFHAECFLADALTEEAAGPWRAEAYRLLTHAYEQIGDPHRAAETRARAGAEFPRGVEPDSLSGAPQ